MSVVKYIRESFEELRDHVTWITFPEAQKDTVVVTIFTIIFALAVFIVDQIFEFGLTKFFTFVN